MSDIHPHDFHQILRSWLLAEDPYGMRQGGGPSGRIEPHFGTPATPAQATQPPAPSDPRASAAGTAAVDQEMDKVNTEQWRDKMAGRKAERARAGSEGQAAVGEAVSPANVRKMIAERAQQPTWSSPSESGAYAGMVGENAVAGVTPPPGPAGWYPPDANAANTNRPSTTIRGPSAGQLTPEQEAQVQEMMRQATAGSPEGDEFIHDTSAIDEFLAGQNRPLMAPQSVAPKPGTVTELSSHPGYATSPARAGYWGPKAVENELDKPSE